MHLISVGKIELQLYFTNNVHDNAFSIECQNEGMYKKELLQILCFSIIPEKAGGQW